MRRCSQLIYMFPNQIMDNPMTLDMVKSQCFILLNLVCALEKLHFILKPTISWFTCPKKAVLFNISFFLLTYAEIRALLIG